LNTEFIYVARLGMAGRGVARLGGARQGKGIICNQVNRCQKLLVSETP